MPTPRTSPILPIAVATYVGVVVGWTASFLAALLWKAWVGQPLPVLAVTAVAVLCCLGATWLPGRRWSAGAAMTQSPLVVLGAIPLPHLIGDPWLVAQLGGPAHRPGQLAVAVIAATGGIAAIGCVSVGLARWIAKERPPLSSVVAVLAAVHVVAALGVVASMTFHGPEPEPGVADPVLPQPMAAIESAENADLVWAEARSAVTRTKYQTAAYRFAGRGELSLSPQEGATRLQLRCADAREGRQHLRLAPLGLLSRDRCETHIELSLAEGHTVEWDLDLSREATVDLPLAGLVGRPSKIAVEPAAGCTVLVHRLHLDSPPTAPRRVVLISLDTHASQHMRFGPGATAAIDTSPALRSLVEGDELAVGYTHGLAAADWTLPSHASVWSGLRPSQHRLFLREPVTSFDERIATLPQILADDGVRTVALLSHIRLGPDYGFARGVEFASLYDEDLGERGRRVVEDALILIDEHRDEDLLLFVHLFDAHTPYTNYPDGYEALIEGVEPHYPEKLYTGRFYRETVKGEEGMDPRTRQRNLRRHAEKFEPEMDAARVAYQLGMRDVDDRVGEFLDGLRDRGLYDSTDVVLFSDHGEEFFGHALLTHTSMYLENIRVPVVVKVRQGSPFAAAARSAGAYRGHTFEAHPTVFRVVLDLFGVAAPIAQTAGGGIGLAELLALDEDRASISELHAAPYSELVQMSVACGGEAHGIVSTYLEDAGRWELRREYFELYDPTADPDERLNLARRGEAVEDPCLDGALGRAQELRALPYRSHATRGLTEDEIERLRALGYLE